MGRTRKYACVINHNFMATPPVQVVSADSFSPSPVSYLYLFSSAKHQYIFSFAVSYDAYKIV